MQPVFLYSRCPSVIWLPAPSAEGAPFPASDTTRNVPSFTVTSHVKELVGHRNSVTPLSVRTHDEMSPAVRWRVKRHVPPPRTAHRPVHGPLTTSLSVASLT